MKQIKHIWLLVTVALATLATFTACTREDDIQSSSNTPTPLRIQATINNSGWGGTRLDEEGFDTDDKIGITGSVDKNVPYVYDTDGGSWTPPENGTPVYFNNMYEEFTAYYPYTEIEGNSTVLTECKDYLFAKATATIFRMDEDADEDIQLNFQFKHVMSKLSINLQQYGDSCEVLKVTLQNSGTFNILTGEAKATGEAAEIEYEDEMVIFPQASIVVSFTCYGKEQSVTIKPNNGFESGKSYNYTIKRSTVIEDSSKVQLYDYVLNDGTFINSSITDISEYKGKIVGVVFYVGKLTDSKLGDYNHGLIVGLNDLTYDNSYDISWQGSKYTECADVQGWIEANLSSGNYADITSEKNMQGYNNTQAIKEYNKSATYIVKPVAALEDVTAISDKFSTWYIPSYAEQKLWEQASSLNTFLGKIGSEISDSYRYWSSTECKLNQTDTNDYTYGWAMIYNGDASNAEKCKTAHVRAICAF